MCEWRGAAWAAINRRPELPGDLDHPARAGDDAAHPYRAARLARRHPAHCPPLRRPAFVCLRQVGVGEAEGIEKLVRSSPRKLGSSSFARCLRTYKKSILRRDWVPAFARTSGGAVETTITSARSRIPRSTNPD